jgi:hypothetical protein
MATRASNSGPADAARRGAGLISPAFELAWNHERARGVLDVVIRAVEALISQLVEAKLVNEPSDLYRLEPEDIAKLDRRGMVIATKDEPVGESEIMKRLRLCDRQHDDDEASVAPGGTTDDQTLNFYRFTDLDSVLRTGGGPLHVAVATGAFCDCMVRIVA